MARYDARKAAQRSKWHRWPHPWLEFAGGLVLGAAIGLTIMQTHGFASPEPDAGLPTDVPSASAQGWDAVNGAGAEQVGTMLAGQAGTVHVDPTPNPQASVRAIVRASPVPAARAVASRTQVGYATWYSGTRGFLGRATAALPTSRYTGHISGYVRVCILLTGRCARLPIVDCLCQHAPGVIVDLSKPALGKRYLNVSPSTGRYRVSVTRVP